MLSEREIAIILIDNDKIEKADVIVLLEGDGFSRLEHCAKLLHQGYATKICFSGGAVNLKYGSFPFEMFKEKLKSVNLHEDDFILELNSQHTQQQAYEVITLAKKYNWKKIILVASHYHQYRAYLTFLKELIVRKGEIVLINNQSRDLSWFENIEWGKRIDLLQSEFEKIEKYMALGHCATYREAIDYQKWKEEQILKK